MSKQISKEKKSHGVQLLIRAVVTDPDGKVLSDTGQKPSKSFVIQFLEFVYAMFSGVNVQATRVTGAEGSIYHLGTDASKTGRIDAPANEDKWGIVLGTGDTAETNTDYKLETKLTEGTGAGNITHGAMDIDVTAVVDANVDLVTKRSFPNNTGSLITAKEAGIRSWWGTIPYHYLLIRDVLGAPGIGIPDKCALTIYYTYRTTV